MLCEDDTPPSKGSQPNSDRNEIDKKQKDWSGLKRPAMVLAPMVDASELAWRLLGRRHGVTLAYSPMFHAAIFKRDLRYRKEALQSCSQDRPLIIQFCGNNAETLLEAAKLAEGHCDGIDINLGCPQAIAKRGNYGAFLQDDWPLLSHIVSTLSRELNVPVSCKVRVFESMQKTVEYAQMLENSGCSLLTVHGRTRDQKGPLTGLASWEHVKAVKEHVRIPVFGNGNVQGLEDIHRFLQETGVDGVMSAEGHLTNPHIFDGHSPPVWDPALEYLEIVKNYPCPNSYIRGHLFKLCHKLFSIQENVDIREEIAKGSSVEEFKNAISKLKDRYLPVHEGRVLYEECKTNYDLHLPPWICQPYVRIPPEEHIQKMAQKAKESQEKENCSQGHKRILDANGEVLSKKKMKKLARKPSFHPHCRREMPICSICPNPVGLKCSYSLCKCCCKKKCYTEEKDCSGHKILIKTRREQARLLGKTKKDEC